MVRSLNEGAISGLNESFTNLAAVSVHLYGSDHFGRIWLHLLAFAYASVSPHVFLRAGLRAERWKLEVGQTIFLSNRLPSWHASDARLAPYIPFPAPARAHKPCSNPPARKSG